MNESSTTFDSSQITVITTPIDIKTHIDSRGGHPRFYKILDEMADLHSRKNANYAEDQNPLSNLRECAKFGIKPTDGVITRMSDKWSRLQQLWGGKEDKVGESIKDTLMDLAIYSILLMILIEEGDTLKG